MNHYFSHHSCYDAGLILRSPQEVTSVPQDLVSAFQYFSKGCSLGNFKACHEVSLAYHLGRGVEQNQVKADEFKKRAEEISSVERGKK